MSKDLGGRPTVMTAEVIAKLEEAFAEGASDLEACFLANINPSSLYRYQQEHPEFSTRKTLLKDMPLYLARKNVVASIKRELKSNGKEAETSKWYLERKKKDEFSTRTETTGADGKALEVQVVEDTALGRIIDGELVEESQEDNQITSLV